MLFENSSHTASGSANQFRSSGNAAIPKQQGKTQRPSAATAGAPRQRNSSPGTISAAVPQNNMRVQPPAPASIQKKAAALQSVIQKQNTLLQQLTNTGKQAAAVAAKNAAAIQQAKQQQQKLLHKMKRVAAAVTTGKVHTNKAAWGKTAAQGSRAAAASLNSGARRRTFSSFKTPAQSNMPLNAAAYRGSTMGPLYSQPTAATAVRMPPPQYVNTAAAPAGTHTCSCGGASQSDYSNTERKSAGSWPFDKTNAGDQSAQSPAAAAGCSNCGQKEQGCTAVARFSFNSRRLKPFHKVQLQKLAAAIISQGNTIISVTGHTDSSGTEAYNDQLGYARAKTVAQELSSMLNQLKPGYQRTVYWRIDSKGETAAVSADAANNRRVEICLQSL